MIFESVFLDVLNMLGESKTKNLPNGRLLVIYQGTIFIHSVPKLTPRESILYLNKALEVNHHFQNAGSFRMMINPYLKNGGSETNL